MDKKGGIRICHRYASREYKKAAMCNDMAACSIQRDAG